MVGIWRPKDGFSIVGLDLFLPIRAASMPQVWHYDTTTR
jgi:hypothetical protein